MSNDIQTIAVIKEIHANYNFNNETHEFDKKTEPSFYLIYFDLYESNREWRYSYADLNFMSIGDVPGTILKENLVGHDVVFSFRDSDIQCNIIHEYSLKNMPKNEEIVEKMNYMYAR